MRVLSAITLCLVMAGAPSCRTETPDTPDIPTPDAPPAPDPDVGSLPELVVYTYDSMVAEGGLGPKIFPLFEKQCGCEVKALAAGDAGAMVTRLQLDAERGKPTAHVVLGLDQNLWGKVFNRIEGWGEWKPKGYDRIPEHLRVDLGFLPYDYGVLAFIADMDALQKAGLAPPKSFRELAEERWKRKFILQDARSSSPGLAFHVNLKSIFKDENASKQPLERTYGRLLRNALATMPGWGAAYGAFLKGEAPLVWSYTTSEAYHREEGQGERYKALAFDDPHPVQIEGAALVRGALSDEKDRVRAREFLEFLLSEPVQAAVPKSNWMLPVIPGTPLPGSFKDLPTPKRLSDGVPDRDAGRLPDLD